MSPPRDCNNRTGMLLHVSGGRTGAAATTASIGSEEPFFYADLRPRSIRLPEEVGEGSHLHHPRKSHSGTKSSGQTSRADTHAQKLVRAPIVRGVAPGSRRPSAHDFRRERVPLEACGEQDCRG